MKIFYENKLFIAKEISKGNEVEIMELYESSINMY